MNWAMNRVIVVSTMVNDETWAGVDTQLKNELTALINKGECFSEALQAAGVRVEYYGTTEGLVED